eukprot:7281138-Karenia_brevis.AAC.1
MTRQQSSKVESWLRAIRLSIFGRSTSTQKQCLKSFNTIAGDIHDRSTDTIDNMWDYANLKPARKRAWNEAMHEKNNQHTAEHFANMSAASSSWQRRDEP